MAWPTLVTDRLVLRPFTPDDLEPLSALHAETSFWYFPLRRGMSHDETAAFLRGTIRAYTDPGVAVSAVEVSETGELAGWAGLAVPGFLPHILPAVEVGWRLGERFRGRGYATEAAAEWLRYGFEVLGLDEVVSIYEPDNAASRRVMDRLGFDVREEVHHPGWGVDLRIMSLTRATWARQLPPGR